MNRLTKPSVWLQNNYLALSLLLVLICFSPMSLGQELNQLDQATPNFPSRVSVRNAQITADGEHIVFIANLIGSRELFSIAVGGNEDDIVRLNVDLVETGRVTSFTLSPDGKTVVYLADAEAPRQDQVFSVPVTGGESIPLTPNASSFTGRSAGTPLLVDPSGSFVLYRLDLTNEDEFELFRAPIGGGDIQALSRGNTRFRPVQFTPDGSNVVFASDDGADDVFELFSVPLQGSANDVSALHPSLNSNQEVSDAEISPDGITVIYEVSTEVSRFNIREELFSAALDGSGRNSFTPLVENYPSAIGDIQDFAISSDGQSVVYTSDQRIDSTQELFKVSISGGQATRLSGDFQGFDRVRGFAISPTGNRVVYQAGGGADTLFSVPLGGDGTQAQALETPFDDVNDVMGFVISGDGRNVIYEKRLEIDGTIQLFIAPVTGGQQAKEFSQVFGDPEEDEEGSLSISLGGQHLAYVPPDDRRIFTARIALPNDDSELCLPIKTQNNRVAVICL